MQPFNKYYPPDWTPDKGSVNKFIGKHPLGDRARKIDQGILIVRFELPFNIWCTGCDNHIGKGVRYNAEKKKIGNYYSTPILQFRMRCHLCSNWIEIHTDPKNAAYVVVSGARKKVEEWEPEDSEVIRLKDEETKERLENDPMFRLEHEVQDKVVAEEKIPVLTQLQRLNDVHWSDPYTRSQQLRRKFREEKKREKAAKEVTERLRDKHSLHIDLLPESPTDQLQAQMVHYGGAVRMDADKRKLETTVAPLFKGKKKLKASTAAQELGLRAAMRTKLKTDPFLKGADFIKKTEPQSQAPVDNVLVKPVKKDQDNDSNSQKQLPLVSYTGSDSE